MASPLRKARKEVDVNIAVTEFVRKRICTCQNESDDVKITLIAVGAMFGLLILLMISVILYRVL